MHAPAKYFEKGLCWVGNGLWYALQPLYRIARNPSFTPNWSDRPLLKSNEKFRPPLGVPRETTSLCPTCTREARQKVTDGEATPALFIRDHAAEIPAQIIERDGKVLMVKDCPTHGHFEDVLSTDPAFFKKMEDMFQGTDIPIHSTDGTHEHGLSALRYGRGTVLTVDLTNRCNMMCDPCFTDANQVGFVHEPEWEEIQAILDRAAAVKPHRQMSVQFSGGEPTLSPHFLKAVAYCKQLGFNSTQAATNGIEFAKDPEFCRKSAEAGLRFVYLQFDGVGNAANQHRRVANLFDVKMRAIENLHAAGVDIVLVSTIINGVNNEQVGRIVEFALDNPKKVSFISFQPVSFTGRDEEISDERRAAQRYTIADLAHDIKRQTGIGEPTRDWFPISLMTTFGDWADLVHGTSAAWGHLNCGCHPDCGSGMAVMIDKSTKERVAMSAFLDGHNLVKDLAVVNDAARGRFLSALGLGVSLLRNYDPFKSPSRLRIMDLMKKFDKAFGATGRDYGKVGAGRTLEDVQKRRSDDWLFLFIAGMWFQDLWTYDFRRTHQCIIPYGTQEGEISFCAYNTGVGWRQIVEKKHQTSTLAAWYDTKGRHQIYTGGHLVPLATTEHSLSLNPEALAAGVQHDLDLAGVAKTSREEKIKARQQEHAS
ncbi:MAG: radical SAM protein [Acidobacteria bacterium]|nr:radical SAM protein [Acidobacteriota bacterium]